VNGLLPLYSETCWQIPWLLGATFSARNPVSASAADPGLITVTTEILEKQQMSPKHVIVTFAAAMTISLSGALCAQRAADEAAAAQAHKRMKMDEATAADDRFHANRTEANMLARDKAEAEAAEAIQEAHAAMERANAAKKEAKAATESGAKASSPR
jgi:hypothetical protein